MCVGDKGAPATTDLEQKKLQRATILNRCEEGGQVGHFQHNRLPFTVSESALPCFRLACVQQAYWFDHVREDNHVCRLGAENWAQVRQLWSVTEDDSVERVRREADWKNSQL